MRIIVNGEEEHVTEGTTLLAYIESRGLDPRTVVAELNLDIVPAEAFAEILFNPDDSLELLHFVGGG